MRFLADESCDFSVVRALRAAGHDVVAVLEVAPGATDTRLIEMAVRERRLFRPTGLRRFETYARSDSPSISLEGSCRATRNGVGSFGALRTET